MSDQRFVVVVNHEEQYSIWAEDREIPAGWRATGFAGPREDCLAHIDEVWTDMRPLSLRRAMEQDEQARGGTSQSSEAQASR